MDEKKYEELKEMVEIRHLQPAINQETGAPVLSRVRNHPDMGYVHLETFVSALEEQGLAVDMKTLEITEAKKPAPAPTPPKQDETPADPPKTEEKPPEKPPAEETPKPTPDDIPKIWTKAALGKLDYKALQAIAKKDPEVPADKKKAELIKLLTGRPKL